jgi:hypothetical protein
MGFHLNVFFLLDFTYKMPVYKIRNARITSGNCKKPNTIRKKDDNDYKDISIFELLLAFFEINPELRQHLRDISNDAYYEFSTVLINNPNLINGIGEKLFNAIITTISAKLDNEQDKILYEAELEYNKCFDNPDGQKIKSVRNSRHAEFLRIIESNKETISHVIM